jgi:hypothetical protein
MTTLSNCRSWSSAARRSKDPRASRGSNAGKFAFRPGGRFLAGTAATGPGKVRCAIAVLAHERDYRGDEKVNPQNASNRLAQHSPTRGEGPCAHRPGRKRTNIRFGWRPKSSVDPTKKGGPKATLSLAQRLERRSVSGLSPQRPSTTILHTSMPARARRSCSLSRQTSRTFSCSRIRSSAAAINLSRRSGISLSSSLRADFRRPLAFMCAPPRSSECRR